MIKRRVGFTLAQVRKGMRPAPNYIATFSNGTKTIMTFWQNPKKAWDFARGRRLAEWGMYLQYYPVQQIDGYIEDLRTGELIHDPKFNTA